MRDPGNTPTADAPVPVPLREVLREWGRIGCIGFGGPPAHIRLLRQLCVERKGWLDAREFEDAIAVCNLMPGAGAGAAVPAVAVNAGWSLPGASWRNRHAAVRWLAYLAAGLAVAATAAEWLVLALLCCGAIEATVRRATRPGEADATAGHPPAAAQVGGLSFGGGFVIIPLMQTDAVSHYHWMTGAQFLNAVALAAGTVSP